MHAFMIRLNFFVIAPCTAGSCRRVHGGGGRLLKRALRAYRRGGHFWTAITVVSLNHSRIRSDQARNQAEGICPTERIESSKELNRLTGKQFAAGHSVWVRPGLVPIPEVKPHVA